MCDGRSSGIRGGAFVLKRVVGAALGCGLHCVRDGRGKGGRGVWSASVKLSYISHQH